MELDELRERLERFSREKLDDPDASVTFLEPGPGHAGFSYFFHVLTGGEELRYFIRMPPPGVKLEGTADVMRQVEAIRALRDTNVPHAPILWAGTEEEWFGCPYFVQPRLEGDVFRGDWVGALSQDQRWHAARQAMAALAGIHKVDAAEAPYLGEFWGFEFDVTRWDRFYERAAEPEMLALQPTVRQKLLDQIPHDSRIAIYHGDFQFGNLLFDTTTADLLAVIDWELTGIGATLNDVGWVCAFNDPRAWAHAGAITEGVLPSGDELEAMYREAYGDDAGDIRWFKALAVYKFGIITGFNLMLHRRGKRHDPHWETMIPSMRSNMEYALSMLSG